MDYDEFLDKYTGFSLCQILFCFGAILITLTTATTHINAIFLSATPIHRCNIPAYDNANCTLTENQIRNYTIPRRDQKYDSCSKYDNNVTSCSVVPVIQPNTSIIPCQHGFHYDTDVFGETTTELWNLVCDRSILNAVATSVFFAGFFIASWTYGPFSDCFSSWNTTEEIADRKTMRTKLG